MLPMSVRDNLSLAALDTLIALRASIDAAREREAVERWCSQLSITHRRNRRPAGALVGRQPAEGRDRQVAANAPRIILLNDPTRGIDVGTKQEIYALLRQLAAAGAAVLLYSTDYAELIGCCDRVVVFFDGRIVRWLRATNSPSTRCVEQRAEPAGREPGARRCSARAAARHGAATRRLLTARAPRHAAAPSPRSSSIFALYIANHPSGWTRPSRPPLPTRACCWRSSRWRRRWSVLTSGIDLSVGMVFVLANCLASHLVVGTPLQAAFGVVAVLAVGALCGRDQRPDHRDRRAAAADHHHAGHRHRVLRRSRCALRPVPGGDVQSRRWPMR